MPLSNIRLPFGGTQQQRIDEIQQISDRVYCPAAEVWVKRHGINRSAGAVEIEDWQRSAAELQVDQIRGKSS